MLRQLISSAAAENNEKKLTKQICQFKAFIGDSILTIATNRHAEQ